MKRLLGVVLLSACGFSDVASSTSAIVGGERSDRDAIVFLFADATTCSAAVVGERHVLTTAQCVLNDGSPISPSRIRVVVGADLAAGEELEVREVLLDALDASPDPNINDFALVVTVEPIGVTPLELASTPVAVGDLITIAGYGQGALTSGTRQEAEATVDMVSDDFFITPAGSPNACSGDGPALDASGALAGNAVFTIGAGCPPDGVYFRDVSVYRDDVLAWIAEADTDAGVDPDAGALDAGALDAGALDAGSDAGTGDAGESGGGGGCSASGSPSLAGFVLLFAFRRRRQ